MPASPKAEDSSAGHGGLSAGMAVLLAWNLVVTGMWLACSAAAADTQSCPGLARQLAEARTALAARDRALSALAVRVRALAQADIRSLGRALAGTGVTVRRLLGRHAAAQGGPFIPVGGTNLSRSAADAAAEVGRWERLRRAVGRLPLGAPLTSFRVGSGFGVRRDPLNRRLAMHEGLDLEAPPGTPVHATAPGRVVTAGFDGAYGRMVELDHGNGLHTRYAHLSAIAVRRGQHVAAGQTVGRLGSSGRSTGPHLHYEVRTDGKARNPALFSVARARLEESGVLVRPRYGSHLRNLP